MITYRFEPQNSRSAAYDDGNLIGVCEFVNQDGQWLITHTYVDPAYQGRGIARDLVMDVLNHASEQQIHVVPVCSYAVKVMQSL